MRRIDNLLAEFGQSHQNPLNKVIYWVCIPLFFFNLVCLIWPIPPGPLNDLYSYKTAAFANWATLSLVLILLY